MRNDGGSDSAIAEQYLIVAELPVLRFALNANRVLSVYV